MADLHEPMNRAWQDGMDSAIRVLDEVSERYRPDSEAAEAFSFLRHTIRAAKTSGGVDMALVEYMQAEFGGDRRG